MAHRRQFVSSASIEIGSDDLGDIISSSLGSGSEEAGETCTPCSTEGRTALAVNYCEECAEYFCCKCIQYHNKFAMMRQHHILDKAGMEARRPQKPVCLPTEKCTRHHGNILDTYCGIHDTVCCGTCVSLNHRSCDGMTYLPTAAKGIKQSAEYKEMKESIAKTLHSLEQMRTACEDELRQLEDEKNAAIGEIKMFKMRVVEQLDRLETSTVDKLLARHRELKTAITTRIKHLKDILPEVVLTTNNLGTFPGENEPQLFVYVKTGMKNVTDGRTLLHEFETRSQRQSLKFNANQSIVDFITKQNSMYDLNNDSETKGNQAVASLLGDFSIKLKGESRCDISACCQIKDGSILATDALNNKLKRLNESYQLQNYCCLPGSPNAICSTGPNEVAIAIGISHKIQFVSVRGSMVLKDSFVVGEFCHGVACVGRQVFVSCNTGVLRVFNRTGTLLRTIDRDPAGHKMFGFPRHISNAGQTIVIADESYGAITVSPQGENYSRLSDNALKCAQGVCVTENGTILVCGYDSQNILQMRTGGGGRVLVSAGPSGPQSLCFDQNHSRLIVAMLNCTEIRVLDLLWK